MLIEKTFQVNNSNAAVAAATNLIKLDKARLIVIEQGPNDQWRIIAVAPQPGSP